MALAAQAQAPAAPSSPAKKELVAKIVQLQQPGIEALARSLVEQPAAQMMQGAQLALRTRVAADKREATATAINGDLKKYMDESVPLARDRALKLAPSTIGAVLEEKMTEDELKQVVAIMESPAFAKYQRLQPELQQALTLKLVAETRPLIEPKIKALDATVGKRLGLEAPAAAPAPAAASGARRPASN
ncbi:MAG: hypothetical protein EOO28_31395 [Comamonadaceae bacterium]|nr:MAG: hypothetical protein EOO28_31395 [Comamonadaceae bacterium]